VDIDDFSQEIARLALTLADVPNANGWSLHCEDMFDGDVLERSLGNADIVLANPPFEDFSASDRPSGSLVNKAAEVVRQTMLQPATRRNLWFRSSPDFLEQPRRRLRHAAAC